jgi:hypothetical protein
MYTAQGQMQCEAFNPAVKQPALNRIAMEKPVKEDFLFGWLKPCPAKPEPPMSCFMNRIPTVPCNYRGYTNKCWKVMYGKKCDQMKLEQRCEPA